MCNTTNNVSVKKQSRKVTLKTYLNQLYHASKKSAIKRESKGRIGAGEHDITLQHLQDTWDRQNGQCFYTGIPMNFNKNEWKVSLERLDTSKGYTKDNIVLCCLELNTRSQWNISKLDDMIHILEQGIDQVTTNFETRPPRKAHSKFERYTNVDGEEQYKCTSCCMIKPPTEFRKLSDFCKACIYDRHKRKRATPKGHLQHLCHTSYVCSKLRQRKNENKLRGEHDIDFQYLVDLYNKQNGLCAYSNLPLKFGSYLATNWVASIERLDVSKGYTKNNVCLICIEFNGPDHTITTGSDYGCAGWNPLKFQYFLAHVQHKKGLMTDEELQAVIDIQEYFKEKEGKTRSPKSPQEKTNTQKALKQMTVKDVKDAIQHKKRQYKNTHEQYGHIYVVTSPSGKQFVGQSHLLYHKNPTSIFRSSIYTLLLKEIQKYGKDNMTIQPLATCRKDKLDEYQEYFIKEFNTYVPNGFNRKKKVRDDVKDRISTSLVNNVARHDIDGEELPKYVKFIDWEDRKGYAIVSHPNCKLKYFVSKIKPLAILKERCLSYLNNLNK
jgi:hypothetical protein